MDRQQLLQNAFGMTQAPAATPVLPELPSIASDAIAPPPPPVPKMPKRGIDPYVTARTQSVVWQNGQLPAPMPSRPAQQGQGVAGSLKPTEGWGQV